MKRTVAIIALAASAAWLLAIPAAAQGRGQGRGAGAGAAGSMGEGHALDASGHSSSATSGPRAPGDLLMQNKQLASKLSNLLPPGTDLQTAASGFKNLGQFVAAVHVSNNLDIPFAPLKCTELATKDACTTTNGTTTVTMTVPPKGSSLGRAIQTLKPGTTSSGAKAAVKEANKQAAGDIRNTNS